MQERSSRTIVVQGETFSLALCCTGEGERVDILISNECLL